MKLVMKYLKPHILLVLVCIVCLLAQVVSDLTLPNLMSDIVDVGIQKGGLEEEAPKSISENGMRLLKFFMTGEKQQLMDRAYQYIMPQSSEAMRYEKEYPLVNTSAIYVRSTRDSIELGGLSRIYSTAAYAMMNFLQNMEIPQGDAVDTGEAQENSGYGDIDITELYNIIPILEQSPPELLQQSIDTADRAEESIIGSVGVNFTRLFYKEVGIDTDEIQSDYIFLAGLKMLGVALIVVIAAVILGLLSSTIAADVARRLRHDLFYKVESFASAEYDRFSTASLITRTTNDVQQVQMLVTMGIRMLCYAPMMGIGGIIFAVNKSVSLSWIIVLTVVVLLGIIMILMATVMPKFKILQKLTDRLNLVSREGLSGMMVIRAFGNEQHEEKRFDKANRDLSDTNLYIQRRMSALMPSMMFMMNVTSLLIVWFGSKAISQSTLQIGDMIAFIQYAMQVIVAFLFIAMLFVFVPRALVSVKRIAEVLDTKNLIEDPRLPKPMKNVKGKVVFDNVSFQYPGAEEKVLENISFTAGPGETTAFIGSTGSGKSTLVNLIPRFYEVTHGSITIDGVDIRTVRQEDLRKSIGYVPQKGLLFSGTIASNLQYGKSNATQEEMHRAIQIAQAEDFVYAEGAGTDLSISQGGTNVSGGQRQRLSIARALTKNAPIYIFDDSFSALDFKTDAKLRRALKENTATATMLIVAQRVSTIMYAEQIVVLDKGKMVGKGTHKQLLSSCPEYREIAESQMAKEELE